MEEITTPKKKGLPKGKTNNPSGNNQWENIRASKPIAVRLLKEQDEAIRAKAEAEGKPISAVIEEAVALYLEKIS
jgi:hypothetical protein